MLLPALQSASAQPRSSREPPSKVLLGKDSEYQIPRAVPDAGDGPWGGTAAWGASVWAACAGLPPSYGRQSRVVSLRRGW